MIKKFKYTVIKTEGKKFIKKDFPVEEVYQIFFSHSSDFLKKRDLKKNFSELFNENSQRKT